MSVKLISSLGNRVYDETFYNLLLGFIFCDLGQNTSNGSQYVSIKCILGSSHRTLDAFQVIYPLLRLKDKKT